MDFVYKNFSSQVKYFFSFSLKNNTYTGGPKVDDGVIDVYGNLEVSSF